MRPVARIAAALSALTVAAVLAALLWQGQPATPVAPDPPAAVPPEPVVAAPAPSPAPDPPTPIAWADPNDPFARQTPVIRSKHPVVPVRTVQRRRAAIDRGAVAARAALLATPGGYDQWLQEVHERTGGDTLAIVRAVKERAKNQDPNLRTKNVVLLLELTSKARLTAFYAERYERVDALTPFEIDLRAILSGGNPNAQLVADLSCALAPVAADCALRVWPGCAHDERLALVARALCQDPDADEAIPADVRKYALWQGYARPEHFDPDAPLKRIERQ